MCSILSAPSRIGMRPAGDDRLAAWARVSVCGQCPVRRYTTPLTSAWPAHQVPLARQPEPVNVAFW